MTFNLGPVNSIDEIDATGDAVKDDVIDALSFTC
jgi:hypothetical protein